MNSLETKLKNLSTGPGVYLMKDAEDNVIYIGKAINLRNRVRSYFRQQPVEAVKTRHLVRHITDFDYILVDTEAEALVLENTLIKKYRPKYNISLKDDKSYPYVRITNEAVPKVFLTRHVVRDGSRYFGPYPNVQQLRETLELLRRIYRYRTCTNSRYNKHEICLNAHIGLCTAPCVGDVSLDAYRKTIDDIAYFFAGHTESLCRSLQEEMQVAAESLDFETAALKRDQLAAVKRISDRQKAVSSKSDDKDVIALARDDMGAVVQVFFIRSGRLLGRENYTLQTGKDNSDDDILASFLKQLYLNQAFVPAQLLIDRHFEDEAVLQEHLSAKHGHRITFHVPQRGANYDLLQMVARNAEEALSKRQLSQEMQAERTSGALEDLQHHLALPIPPTRIECYDISNIQGTDSVASMVVFINGKPDKSKYRRFRIRTVEGANDFASLQEVLQRRFARAKKKGKEAAGFDALPDLVIIDGGKGQLSSARAAMRDEGMAHIPTFALAKQDELLFYEGGDAPVVLPRHSNALYLIQRLRDETHRFAITYHRSLRGKRQLASVLDDIPGVGKKRKASLLTHFGTFSRIQSADIDSLSNVPGISRSLAEEIFSYLQTHEDLQARTKNRLNKPS